MRRSLKWRTSPILAGMLVLLSPAALAQDNKSFAPDKMETVLYGVAYYPEYMPYDRLDKDVEMMQKAGITVVRVGESTWSSWEPRDASGHHTSTGGSLRPRISILDDAWLLRATPELRLPESPLSAACRTRDPRDLRAFQKPSSGDWIPDRQ